MAAFTLRLTLSCAGTAVSPCPSSVLPARNTQRDVPAAAVPRLWSLKAYWALWVAVGGSGVTVTADTWRSGSGGGAAGTVPPPKLSMRLVGMFVNVMPIRPPAAAYGQPATEAVPASTPFLYNPTVPSAPARAPNWSPACNVTGAIVPRDSQPMPDV